MDESDPPLPPGFEPFSLRVVSCARCRQPEVLLAQGQQDDDPAILALGRLAPQLRVPAYALLLPALGDRARVRKVFPGGGEYVLTARQWDHVLSTLLSKHVCPGPWP
jgi:hypothetical protein